jgi:aquaporin TIP
MFCIARLILLGRRNMLAKLRGHANVLSRAVMGSRNAVASNVVTRMFAEALACAMFHFIGSVSPTASANGLALMVLVYYTAKVSGAHLNPAVTMTFCLLGHTTPIEVIFYWIGQVMGCITGALWLAALVPNLHIGAPIPDGQDGQVSGCFVPMDRLSNAHVFAWEAVGTFCFIVPIYSVVWYTQTKSGYGNTGPLIVGLSLMATAMAVGPWTGAALNPARAVGSQIVFHCPSKSKLVYYVLGELVGALVAPCAIIPWYGISSDPWFIDWLPLKLREYMTQWTPDGHEASSPRHAANVRGDNLVSSIVSTVVNNDQMCNTEQQMPTENTYACMLPFVAMRAANAGNAGNARNAGNAASGNAAYGNPAPGAGEPRRSLDCISDTCIEPTWRAAHLPNQLVSRVRTHRMNAGGMSSSRVSHDLTRISHVEDHVVTPRVFSEDSLFVTIHDTPTVAE